VRPVISARGMAPRDLYVLMGHEDEATFKRIYAHVLDLEDDLDAAAEVMAGI
jgi:hypothetical protein